MGLGIWGAGVGLDSRFGYVKSDHIILSAAGIEKGVRAMVPALRMSRDVRIFHLWNKMSQTALS